MSYLCSEMDIYLLVEFACIGIKDWKESEDTQSDIRTVFNGKTGPSPFSDF